MVVVRAGFGDEGGGRNERLYEAGMRDGMKDRDEVGGYERTEKRVTDKTMRAVCGERGCCM